MMIKNITEYTLKKYRQFDMNVNLFSIFFIWISTVLISALLISLPFYTEVSKGFFIVFGVLIFVVIVIVRIIRYATFGKNINKDIIRKYSFDEEGFSVTSAIKGNESTTNYSYSKIMRVRSDRYNVYVFITKKSAFIIGNEGYQKGNKEQLLSLLMSKIEKAKE